jgi:hypothetical protein
MRTVTLNTTGTTNLGDTAEGIVGSFVLQVSGTFSGALKLRKKIKGSVVNDANAPTTYYINYGTGEVIATNTDITAAGLYLVPCAACDLVLAYTHTSGAMVVECLPVLG